MACEQWESRPPIEVEKNCQYAENYLRMKKLYKAQMQGRLVKEKQKIEAGLCKR